MGIGVGVLAGINGVGWIGSGIMGIGGGCDCVGITMGIIRGGGSGISRLGDVIGCRCEVVGMGNVMGCRCEIVGMGDVMGCECEIGCMGIVIGVGCEVVGGIGIVIGVGIGVRSELSMSWLIVMGKDLGMRLGIDGIGCGCMVMLLLAELRVKGQNI